jgi:hypothetical protein
VGQDVADKDFLFVVVKEGNQPGFIAADVEDGKVFDLISTWENLSIDRIYPLSEVPDAIRYLEVRQVKGKVAIQI